MLLFNCIFIPVNLKANIPTYKQRMTKKPERKKQVLSKPEYGLKENKLTKRWKVVEIVANNETKQIKLRTLYKGLGKQEAEERLFKLERNLK